MGIKENVCKTNSGAVEAAPEDLNDSDYMEERVHPFFLLLRVR